MGCDDPDRFGWERIAEFLHRDGICGFRLLSTTKADEIRTRLAGEGYRFDTWMYSSPTVQRRWLPRNQSSPVAYRMGWQNSKGRQTPLGKHCRPCCARGGNCRLTCSSLIATALQMQARARTLQLTA